MLVVVGISMSPQRTSLAVRSTKYTQKVPRCTNRMHV